MPDKLIHSPIRSFGGKGSNGFQEHIYSLFPESFDVYVEPFCGSAVIALNNPVKKCATILNDLNENIYSIFKCLQDESLFKRFKHKCDLFIYHERLFFEYKLLLQDSTLDIVDRAYYFFMVNRMSFSGNNKSFSINRTIRRNISKSTSDILSAIDGLESFTVKMSEYAVFNRDALQVIREEDNKEGKEVFFFLDPPYTWDTRTAARYDVDFTNEQQRDLMDVILQCKSKILLCGYDNPLYNQRLVIENGWKRYDYDINTVTGTNQKRSKTESLWRNF